MINQNYVFISVLFFFFIAVSIITKNPIPILITVPFFVYLILASFNLSSSKIEVKREVETNQLLQYEAMRFTYQIKTEGFKGKLNIEDNTIKTSSYLYNRILNITNLEKFDYFGKYYYDTIKLNYTDLWGLFTFTEEIYDPITIRVLPPMENLRKFSIFPKKTRSLMGDIPSKKIGAGTEFYGIREYERGDYIRYINWKASARSNTLKVNEYESEKSGDAVIVLNVRRTQKVEEEYKVMLDSSVKAAVTIAYALGNTRNRIGLISLKDSIDWIYPGYGKRQLYMIIDTLLQVSSRKISEIPFFYVKRIITRFFLPNSFVIVITHDLDKEMEDTLMELKVRGYEIMIIFPFIEHSTDTLIDQIFRVEQHIKARKLRRYGRVVEWNIDLPLTASIQEGLKSRG